jgi:hypothetical protein
MNKIIFPLRKASTLILLTVALTGGSLVTRAANGGNDHGHTLTGNARTAEVKYIGGREDELVFKVVYNNITGSRFNLKVLDADGNQLFQHAYSDTNFDKTFKVDGVDSYGKLTFIIRNFQDNSTQTFEVSSNTHLVEDVEVKEVK